MYADHYIYLLQERVALAALSPVQQKRAARGRWMAKKVKGGYYIRRISANPEQAAYLYHKGWRLLTTEDREQDRGASQKNLKPGRDGQRRAKGGIEMLTARMAGGTTRIQNNTYFDVPYVVLELVESEIKRVLQTNTQMSIVVDSKGVHDRGIHYVCFCVSSKRAFDSLVDKIADYLDSLAYHEYARLSGYDESRWPVKYID